MAPDCLFSSPWISSVILFTTLLTQLPGQSNGAMYHSHDVTSDSVCSRNHKRELDVSMSEPLILEMRKEKAENFESGNSLALSCNIEVEARGGSKYGVVSVVQAMKFRTQGDSCVDYIQTYYKEQKRKGIKIKLPKKKKKDKTRKIVKAVIKGVTNRSKRDSDDDERGPRICGDVLFGLHVDQNETFPPPFANPLPPTKPSSNQSLLVSLLTDQPNPYQSLVSDAAEVDQRREIRMHLYISNRMMRLNETVRFKTVYTAYQECDGRSHSRSLFHCGYGLCISSDLVNDGLVNCPFGDCIDETNCTNAKGAEMTAVVIHHKPTEPPTGVTGLWTIAVVALLLLVSCGALYYCITKRHKTKKRPKAPVEGGDDEDAEEDKPAEVAPPWVDPSKQPNATFAPLPYQQPPGYMPPPGGQPGYYPMVPPQQGYPQYPQQPYVGQAVPPPGYPGLPMPPPGAGYPGMAPTEGSPAGYPVQGASYPPTSNSEAPVYPSSAAPQQSAPPLPPDGSTMGFGYPQQQAPGGAPYPVNTAPQ